ncbi:MarR family transcriptional regulator [bacterium]|nr:MarR family transcriptional regulator [bacterium]
MKKNISQQAEYLMELFARFHKAVDAQVIKMPEVLTTRMTMGQLRLMHYLMEHGATSMRALAEYSRVVMSTMTDMANRLVRLGMIKRRQDPNDRRLVLLEVTPKGRKEFAAKHQYFREHVTNILRPLPDSERDKLMQAIQTIEHILSKQKNRQAQSK